MAKTRQRDRTGVSRTETMHIGMARKQCAIDKSLLSGPVKIYTREEIDKLNYMGDKHQTIVLS